MKCTSSCSQFSLYHYNATAAFGKYMAKCVDKCPSGLIAHAATMWCVTRCPGGYFLKLENRDTDPQCTDNCTTGYEYSLMN